MTHAWIGLALCAPLSCAPVVAQEAAASQPQRFDLKEDQPRLGSHIKREAVIGSRVPYDKTYDELTPDQQAAVKSQYEAMGPGDEPPYPSHGLLPIVKALSRAQQTLLIDGELMVAVEVSPSGEPLSVSVYQSPDDEMARVAASVLMLQHYRPARCDGRPCQQQFPFWLRFSVRLG